MMRVELTVEHLARYKLSLALLRVLSREIAYALPTLEDVKEAETIRFDGRMSLKFENEICQIWLAPGNSALVKGRFDGRWEFLPHDLRRRKSNHD